MDSPVPVPVPVPDSALFAIMILLWIEATTVTPQKNTIFSREM
jgi:hypothetical protein